MHCKQLLDAASRQKEEENALALKAFELSQQLENRLLTGDVAAKRQILEIICLNYTLNDVSLDMEIRKPFDILAKGPFVSISRSNETRLELFVKAVAYEKINSTKASLY